MSNEEARRAAPQDSPAGLRREEDRALMRGLVMGMGQFDKLSFDDAHCLAVRISRR